jgi:hypothetical protein
MCFIISSTYFFVPIFEMNTDSNPNTTHTTCRRDEFQFAHKSKMSANDASFRYN